MTTLCLASHCAFIASRHIRNNIVLVNSLVDANTDGVIMMLDWAMAYDSVDNGHLENVLFCIGWDWIAETDEHTKGLHTACDCVAVSVRAIQQRKRCPLVPLLFALAIEPLLWMLKQTMTGMQIDRIHVKQDTTHMVVAMCADDTTIVHTIQQPNSPSFNILSPHLGMRQ